MNQIQRFSVRSRFSLSHKCNTNWRHSFHKAQHLSKKYHSSLIRPLSISFPTTTYSNGRRYEYGYGQNNNHKLRDATISSNNSFHDQNLGPSKKSFSSLSNRFWDMVHSRSFKPINPIVNDLTTNLDMKLLSFNYSNYQPHHFVEAAEQLQSTYEMELSQLEDEIKNDVNISCTYLMSKLNDISQPIITLQNIIVLYSCVRGSNINDTALNNALSDASNLIQLKHETSQVIHDALKQYELLNIDDEKLNEEQLRVIQFLLRKHRINGVAILDDETKKETLDELNKRLSYVESKFVTLSSYTMELHGKVTPTQKLLPLLYEIISLKNHKAQLLGYDNFMTYGLDYHSCMVKNGDEVKEFHDSFVKENVVEKFGNDDFISQHFEVMDDNSLSSDALKDYFEFNTVLEKLFNLSSMLFDIHIEEEKDPNKVLGWDKDVRLFHIYENEENGDSNDGTDSKTKKHIASFYIDPFRRLNKDSGEFMAPIVYRSNSGSDNSSTSSIPIVAISLYIKPPMWDDSPNKLDFDDVLHLFHEFGHALQHLLAKVDMGAFSGAQTIEEDASEVVSQVR